MESKISTFIRLNSIGYLPFQQKKASIAASCNYFSVVDAKNNLTVFNGTVSAPVLNKDTQELICTADFSQITAPGIYFLHVGKVGDSIQFEIGSHIYREPFRVAMLGMYLWRCGIAVDATYKGVNFSHGACHLEDARMDFEDNNKIRKDAIGGWHDAGDYNKYVVNAGITLYLMIMAWEQFGIDIQQIEHIPVNTDITNIPQYLQEIKWEIDWLFSMQLDSGAVSHKISTLDFCGFIMPEEETEDRYFSPWGTTATADFVAIMAAASRIFREYDSSYADRCMGAAIKSYGFLRKHPGNHAADQRKFHTGLYASADKAHRLWAAAEMFESTGNSRYLKDFEKRAQKQVSKIDTDFNWKQTKNLGMIRYLISRKKGKKRSLEDAISNELISVAESIVNTAQKHGYNRSLGESYCWGGNGNLLNQVLILQAANTIKKKRDYQQTALDSIGYIFGRNSYCRSFVTGLGFNPPLYPHDRRSGADKTDMPWPGYMVGGPAESATDYKDDQQDCRTNEIAVNWNAALIYALAGFLNCKTVLI